VVDEMNVHQRGRDCSLKTHVEIQDGGQGTEAESLSSMTPETSIETLKLYLGNSDCFWPKE
jgi:hypothetical protein